MTFQPRMRSVRDGITVLDELKWRAWNGVVADLWHAECATGASGEYVSEHPRLFIVLDKLGGDFTTRLEPNGPALPSPRKPGSLSYFPAKMPVWGRTERKLRIRHLDLHFDAGEINERLGEQLDPAKLAEPRVMLTDERLLSLARLIAAECAEPDARHDLYGDGLTLALLIDLFDLRRKPERRRTPLASWQLRRVTDYIEANCAGSIRLQELARLVDLSQSYFSHAFKASTGLPPHQWQLQARVRKGQDLLLRGDRSLTEVAVEAGFSDQAHFTRVFRRIVGDTPAAWRRSRQSIALPGEQ